MKATKRRFFAYCFAPDANLFHVVARMKDVPGALNSVLTLLSSRVNILGSVSYGTLEGMAIWSAFVEALSKNETGPKLVKLLSQSKFVEESVVMRNEEGLLVDSFHSGIEVELGEDFILLPARGVSHTYDELTEVFGSGGDTILFNEGFSLGKINSSYFARLLGLDLARQRISQLIALYGTMGWGNVEFAIGGSGSTFNIRVANCFECSAQRKVRQTCSFVRGHLTGVLNTIFEHEMRGKESKCRFRGDPICEFDFVQT